MHACGRVLGQRWKAMSDADKQQYTRLADPKQPTQAVGDTSSAAVQPSTAETTSTTAAPKRAHADAATFTAERSVRPRVRDAVFKANQTVVCPKCNRTMRAPELCKGLQCALCKHIIMPDAVAAAGVAE